MAYRVPSPGEIYRNSRNGFLYEVTHIAQWSDSPDENNLELWVVMKNTVSKVVYVRSVESFCGINRNGDKRFVRVGDRKHV